jgi:zinc transporter ZupT
MDTLWIEILSLFLIVFVAGGIVVVLNKDLHGKSKFLLSFSGAFLLGFCLLTLIPFVYGSSLAKPGLWILGGFLIQIVLEYFSEGIEHGHFHKHGQSNFPSIILISLSIHAFFEGMPFGGHAHDHHHSLLAGILIHKVPVALVLASMMITAGFSKIRSMTLITLFALASPAGAYVYMLLGQSYSEQAVWMAPAANGLLIGILLHVSTTIIFETSEGHRFNLYKFLTIILGLALAFFAG